MMNRKFGRLPLSALTMLRKVDCGLCYQRNWELIEREANVPSTALLSLGRLDATLPSGRSGRSEAIVLDGKGGSEA